MVVTAHLLDNFHHAADGPDSIQITGLAVVARDIDGSTAASSQFTVAISDDSASVSLGDAPSQVAEGASVTGQWVLVAGADGVTEVTVSVSFGQEIKVLDLGNPNNSVILEGAEGRLTVFANGTWTFTAANNQQNAQEPLQFTLAVRDGDDDTASVTDSQSIQIIDGTIPPVGHDFQSITVQEAGLPGSSGASTASFAAGSDDLVNFALRSSAIVVNGATLNVTWSGDGTGQLVGQIGGVDVIRLTLSASMISALGSGDVTVTAELLSNFPHAPGNGQVTISGIQIVASEADGDAANPATLSINIGDDVATANADVAVVVTETDGTTAGTSLLANDSAGADGATVTAVDFGLGGGLQAITSGVDLGGGVYRFSTANGIYTFKADGSWTFDPNSNLNNAAGVSAGFTYQITDGDGDTSTAVQVITVNDGAVAATPVPVTLELNEAALPSGSNPALTTEVDNAPSLSFTAASDNLTSFAFSGVGGLVTDLDGTGGQDIFWVQVSGTQIKGYLDAGHTLLGVTLDLGAPALIAAGATGSVTVTATLSDNLPHALAGAAQISAIGSVGVVATDTDGDTTTGTVNITVKDDVPTIGAFDTAAIANQAGSVTGTFAFVPGSDGVDHFNITGPAIDGVSYASVTTTDPFGGTITTLTATIDPDGAGGSQPITLYALAVHADGTYTFDLITPTPGTTTTYSLADLPAGGPDWRETADGAIEFSSAGGVNSNNNGFGVGNTFVGGNETFTMEFHNPGTVGDDPASTSADFNDSVNLNVNSLNGAGGTYHWIATNTLTNAVESGDISITSSGSFLINPSISFNQLQISAVDVDGQGAQFSAVSLTKDILPQNQDLSFSVSAVDGDGDTTAVSSLAVHIEASGADGSFVLTGTSADDVIGASTHVDVINGGAGFDIADYSDGTAAISINLDDGGAASGIHGTFSSPTDGNIAGGDAAGDSLAGIEGVRGGSGNDFIYGNSSGNTLYGNGGNDTLYGEGGADTLYGGAGLNIMTGGGGDDTFVIDPSALAEFDMVDVIADYTLGEDLIDLSALFASLGLNAPANDAEADAAVDIVFSSGAAHVFVDDSGTATGGTVIEVASVTGPGIGVGAAISILYDSSHPAHSEAVVA